MLCQTHLVGYLWAGEEEEVFNVAEMFNGYLRFNVYCNDNNEGNGCYK